MKEFHQAAPNPTVAMSIRSRLERLVSSIRGVLSPTTYHRSNSRQRTRIVLPAWPAVIYAVGDIHGSLALLKRMDELIRIDCEQIRGRKLVVMLGDYVDRGPASAQVLDWLMAPMAADIERICLAGNHEEAMLAFLSDPFENSRWLDWGGTETLRSYGLDVDYLSSLRNKQSVLRLVSSHIPEEHIELLRRMPVMVRAPGVVLVHAGLRVGVALDMQSDGDLQWVRDGGNYRRNEHDPLLIHGHTPGASPFVSTNRICLDTGAYNTGVLSAVRLTSSDQFKIISCSI